MTTIPVRRRSAARSTLSVTVWELDKLTAQFRVRLAFVVCLVGPFLFAAALRLTQTLPADTLFGRWSKDSGFAVPLVVLGFAGSWALPLLVSLVAGDVFAAEDRYGTWPVLLTRSRSRSAIYAGKVAAAVAYTVAMVALLAASSLAAGVLIEGTQPLVGLSGNVLPAGRAAELVVAAWASVLPTCLAYAALAVLFSVWTRNVVAGVVVPTVLGLVMQLLLLVSGIGVVRIGLLSDGFIAWHGLFAEPAFPGPVGSAAITSVVWIVLLSAVSLWLLRRRNVTGA